ESRFEALCNRGPTVVVVVPRDPQVATRLSDSKRCQILSTSSNVRETANGSLNQLWFLGSYLTTWITVAILELIHAAELRPSGTSAFIRPKPIGPPGPFFVVTLYNLGLIARARPGDLSFKCLPYQLSMVGYVPTMVVTGDGESGIHWRASLVPAAAVIPAPIAYIKVVAVKKLVVGSQLEPGGPPTGGHCLCSALSPVPPDDLHRLSRVTGKFTLKKLECSKQARRLNNGAWNNGIGPRFYFVGFRNARPSSSAEQESSKDWKLKMAVNHLMQNLNSPSADFLSTYLTLPILNGKSLSDIKNTECSDGLKQKYEDKKEKILYPI
ncbi:uncharacterized protein CDAR_489011, partial [Caerostris darwini]